MEYSNRLPESAMYIYIRSEGAIFEIGNRGKDEIWEGIQQSLGENPTGMEGQVPALQASEEDDQ